MSEREQYYLVSEDQSTVVAGPYGSIAELRKLNPGRPEEPEMIVATDDVLEMIELASGSLEWENEQTEGLNNAQ